MQIAIPAEAEEAVRIIALQVAQWYYEITETAPRTDDDVTAKAAVYEHYLTNGQTVAFDCRDTLSKTVR